MTMTNSFEGLAIFALLAAAPTSTLAAPIDTSPPQAALCCIGAGAADEFAQEFIARASVLDDLSVYVRGDTAAPLRLRIRVSEGGAGGAVLYESGIFSLAPSSSFALLATGLELPVTSGATYAWSLEAEPGLGRGVIGVRVDNPYAEGRGYQRFGDFWAPLPANYDAAFVLTSVARVVEEPSSTALIGAALLLSAPLSLRRKA